jgi:transposase-like protein
MGVDQRAQTFHLDLVAVDTQLVEAEATQVIGAGRDAGTESRVTERNGRRAKTLATKADDIGIGIPKLRKAASSSILEPRRRIDQALHRDSTMITGGARSTLFPSIGFPGCSGR